MKQFITRLSVVALAIAAMVACGDKKGVDYTNIIPEHPMVLVEVDGYKTLDEAGLIDLVAPYREQAAALLGSQAGELVKNIILDVNNTGIETEAPMFLFVTGEENVEEMKVVAVAKVGDKAKVDELVAFVEENVGEIRKKEKDGAVVISIEDEEEFMLGYNDHALVFAAEPDGAINSSDIFALLDKTATPRATELAPMVGNSRVVVDLAPIFALVDQNSLWDEMNIDAETMAQVEAVRNAVLTVDNIITEGKIVHTWTFSGMDEKFFNDAVKDMPRVSNAFAEYIPEQSWAVLNFAINSTVIDAIGKAFESVGAAEGIGKAERELVMSFLSTLSGDVTLALNGADFYYETIDAQAIIGTTNSSIYSYAQVGATMALGLASDEHGLMMPVGNNIVRLGQEGENILWAGVNNILGTQSDSIKDAAWFETVEDKAAYAVVNIAEICDDPTIRGEMEEALYDELDDETAVAMVMDMVDLVDYALFYSDVDVDNCASTATFELVLKSDADNALKQVVDIVGDYVEELAPAMMGF